MYIFNSVLFSFILVSRERITLAFLSGTLKLCKIARTYFELNFLNEYQCVGNFFNNSYYLQAQAWPKRQNFPKKMKILLDEKYCIKHHIALNLH